MGLLQEYDSLTTPPRLKDPANSDPVKRWNSRKADWKHFCLLTGESDERLPPPVRLHQTLRGHTRIFAKAYYLQSNNVSHVAAGKSMGHAGTKSARPSIAPSSEPRWGLTLIEPLRPYVFDSNNRSRSDGRKL